MTTLPELVGKMNAAAGRAETRHYRPHSADSAAGFKIGGRIGGRGSTASAFLAAGGSNRRGGGGENAQLVAKIYRDDDRDHEIFKNEVRMLTMLSTLPGQVSPAVIAVGAITSMGAGYETMLHPWILMEHGGDSLKSIIPQLAGDRVTTTELARQLCMALAFIHRAGIIHCDVNPSNITVRDRRIKLIDFGLATPVGEVFARHPGTICYRAPEIGCELGYSTKCDIWSAGIVIFEMFTGFIPFDFYGDYDVMYSVDDGMDNADETTNDSDGTDDENAMSEDHSENGSSSEEKVPADLVAETINHLTIIYKVIAAPDPQPAGFAVNPVPVPLGLSELISLNIDADIADIWYITDIVAPLLKFDPAERPAAENVFKN